jgi:hypothetical protein
MVGIGCVVTKFFLHPMYKCIAVPVAAFIFFWPLYPKYLRESGGHWDPCPSLLDGDTGSGKPPNKEAGPYAWGETDMYSMNLHIKKSKTMSKNTSKTRYVPRKEIAPHALHISSSLITLA